MRIGPWGEAHLAYCTNIHPGETWPEVMTALRRHLPPLKAALSPGAPFGIGLRLSAAAAEALEAPGTLEKFAGWLGREGLYVFTLNGFPYGGFHRTAVKDRVYAPDWTRPERLAYTRRLAAILARLLPEGVEGGISTVPLSYKPWLAGEAERAAVREAAARNLAECATVLSRIEAETGRLIHLDLEPEPDCLLEDVAETIAFFRHDLLRPRAADERMLLRHLRVCWDACHLALAYENPAEALAHFEAAGIGIGKLQVSAALKAALGDGAARRALAERLRPFAESTYLHQVVERRADGGLRRHFDLGPALARIEDPEAREWRIHFHVPVFCPEAEGLATTQPDLRATLDLLRRRGFTRHVEIETYTWEVLPPALKLDLHSSLLREYEWTLDALETGA